jgi:hypothetical protein
MGSTSCPHRRRECRLAATPLGLYELLAPQFLVGFTFPEHVDRYLSVLGVDDLRAAHDGAGVVYSGRCSFVGDAGAAPVRAHRDPSGAIFEWEDVALDFRLTIPRDGGAFVDTAVSHPTLGSPPLDALFDRFGPVEGLPVPTEYPGIRFRLELLVSALTFHLGPKWLPATLDADRRVVPDPARTSNDVKFVLPKVVLVYEQGDDLTRPPSFELASWGSGGFDAPHDLLAGEVVRMEPALAIHESGRVGFGVGQVVLDLSEDSTPPEILQFFGTDEAFRGVYVRSARVFWSDKDKGFAVNAAVQDVLVSFAGEVSLEASVDFIGPQARLQATVRFFEGPREVDYVKGTTTGTIVPGQASILNTAEVQVLVSGGIPPYTVEVRLGSGASAEQLWNPTTRRALISPGAPATLRQPGRAELHITVTDGGTPGTGGTRQTYLEDIDLTIRAAPPASAAQDGAPADRPRDAAPRPDAVFDVTSRSPDPLPAGYGVSCTPASSGLTERIVVIGAQGATVTAGGSPRTLDAAGSFSLDVPEGGDIPITVSWPASPAGREVFELRFQLDRPDPEATEPGFAAILADYVADVESPPDIPFSTSPPDGTGPLSGSAALRDWIQNRVLAGADAHIEIDAHASFENSINAPRDQTLSERRLAVAREIVLAARPGATFDHATAHGHTRAANAKRKNNGADRVALVEAATSAAASAVSVQARIRRATAPTTPPTPTPVPAPAPPPEPNRRPPVFRRAGVRVRLERNVLVLGEISGRLDLETDIEQRLRQQTASTTGDLQLAPTTAAVNQNPEDGVVDFLLGVTYDTATHQLTERLALGASPDDRDGLLQMTNPRASGSSSAQNVFKDVFGALLVMAPVINSAASAIDPDSAGDWVGVTVALAVPVTVGSLGVFKTDKVTLYGGELRLRQNVPPGEALTFTDAGVIFDYGVEFGIEISQLDIATTKPLKVRYRAAGFNLHFPGGITYQPIFDTSRGYELDLSDPGLFQLPSPLGDLLKILAARIARTNPLTIEVDLGLKVDLGVVTVDRFKVRWPLDPLGPPTILPTGVKVDISSVLVGSGYVNIIEPSAGPGGGTSGGGFEGTADVSLVPLKLRISASLGVRSLQAGDRKAVAVFAGLIVEFPAPIPLGQSGIGIFGFSGLFAMHYKRDELAPDGTAVSPALRWLIRAKGEPAKLIVAGDTIWVPELDRWSFGVGTILGTAEGGFVANLRGMLVLELPGPRILIFIKLQVIAALPDLGDAGLDAGFLGAVDLDFGRSQLTVGVVADIGVGEIIRVTIPTELFVKLNNPRIWHLYLGTHRAPASALVLNLVRASGYFMVEGDQITDWPGTDPPSTLTGLALAAGLEASIVLGNEGIGLYLRVAAGAHLGISFAPVLFVAGRIYIEGELRLFIISIEARGELEAQVRVNSPTDVQTFIRGKICGKVSFFFFSVQGCVEHSVGTPVLDPPAPPLVNNVFLQSHAPVLTSGQGGDRPIDASLGDAARAGVTTLPEVPIDSVPVVQMAASPRVAGAITFTKPLVASPQQTADGYIKLGGGRQALYELKELALSPAIPSGAGLPPATWRTERPPNPQSADTTIDLALMSRIPTVASRALERSTDLDASIERRWKDLCKPVAPATCVLHTFCGQPLGPSGDGWRLVGTPWPDPPGTVRTTPVPNVLDVEEPPSDPARELIDLLLAEAGRGSTFPAEVIGPNVDGGRPETPEEEMTCVRFPRATPRPGPNPLGRLGVRFAVRDATGALAGGTQPRRIGKVTGLDVGFRTEIALPAPSRAVELRIAHFGQPARLAAFAADGTLVDKAVMTAPVGELEVIRLGALRPPIAWVRIDAARDETLLASVCFVPGKGERLPIEEVRPPDFRPSGDPRLDRLAEMFLERRETRERIAASEAMERRTAMALRTEEGLAAVAGIGPRAAAGRAAAAAATSDRLRCHRALKLPHRSETDRPEPLEVPRELEAEAETERGAEDGGIVLRTGRAALVTIFLAASKPALDLVVVRQLAPDGTVLDERPLADFGPAPVSGVTTGLPARWIDPAGPWRAHVEPVATFLASPDFAGLDRLVVSIRPEPDADRLQLLVLRGRRPVRPPGVLVGVVEVCPTAEQEREATDEVVKQGQIETLIDYLNGGAVVPLLAPNKTYTLKVRYDVRTRLEGGSPGSPSSRTEEFRFKTDDQAPARLDPWVLGTTPDDEERHHFTDDPVKLVFNDLAILQLYGAYGKKLRFVLRTADGVPIPTHEVASLDPVDAGLSTPYRDFLEGMVAAGELPCVGSTTVEKHGSWTSPVPLRPLMDYTLDVEMDPAPPPPPATEPRVPLFRRTFTTSRFAGLAELVEDLQRKRIRHRALRAPLAGLPTQAPVAVAPDETIQAALVTAGEQARGAPEENGIVVYWARRPGAATFSLHAILIDAAEPLWRFRQEPKLETVPGQLDPAYQRIVPAQAVALRLSEQGSTAIQRWVRSPGGTRTLALVKDTFAVPAAGTTVTIRAERPASTLYGLGAQAVTLLALRLADGGAAPWETDDA